MTKERFLGVWFAAIGLLVISTLHAQSETEAESAAASERALTASEIALKETNCHLPVTGKVLNGVPSGIHAVRTEFTEQKFLALFILDGDSAAGNEGAADVFRPLPKGGIGARDLCDAVRIGIMPPHLSTTKSIIVALRLRPGLDLEENYPTAAAQIRQFRQILPISAPGFALIAIDDPKQAGGFVAQLADWTMIAPGGYYFVTGNNLYVPLRE